MENTNVNTKKQTKFSNTNNHKHNNSIFSQSNTKLENIFIENSNEKDQDKKEWTEKLKPSNKNLFLKNKLDKLEELTRKKNYCLSSYLELVNSSNINFELEQPDLRLNTHSETNNFMFTPKNNKNNFNNNVNNDNNNLKYEESCVTWSSEKDNEIKVKDEWNNVVKETKKSDFINMVKETTNYNNNDKNCQVNLNKRFSKNFSRQNVNNNTSNHIYNSKNMCSNLNKNTKKNSDLNLNFFQDDQSFISNNLEEINELIEEKYNALHEENMFLKREYHSILPFLMTNKKDIHRFTLSDFEIKIIMKEFYRKSKTRKAESFDYYKLGIIEFYRGRYISAFEFFYAAVKMSKKTDSINLKLNFSKWLAFAGIVVFFAFLNSEVNSINKNYNGCFKIRIKESITLFSLENSILNNNNKKVPNESANNDGFFSFCCSGARKDKVDNKNTTSNTISNSNLNSFKRVEVENNDLVLENLVEFYKTTFFDDLILNSSINPPYLTNFNSTNSRSSNSLLKEILAVDDILETSEGLTLSTLADIITKNLEEVSMTAVVNNIEEKDSDQRQYIYNHYNNISIGNNLNNKSNVTTGQNTSENAYFHESSQMSFPYRTVSEAWYLNTLIAVFTSSNFSNISNNNSVSNKHSKKIHFKQGFSPLFDTSQCLKKLKSLDNYLAYIAFCDVNCIKLEIQGFSPYSLKIQKINAEKLLEIEKNRKNSIENSPFMETISSSNSNEYKFNNNNNGNINANSIKKLSNENKLTNEKELNFNNFNYNPYENNESLTKYFDEYSILKSLINKFPKRIEAYLKYWHLLSDKHHSQFNLKKAYSLTESFWKTIAHYENYENAVYYLYVILTQAKTAFKLENVFYAITFIQKEFPTHFYYPSIYFYFAELTARSSSLSLNTESEIAYETVFPLVYEDLQNVVYFSLGNIYFSNGKLDKAYDYWRQIDTENIFNISKHNLSVVKNFMQKYNGAMVYLMDIKSKVSIIKELEFNKLISYSYTQENVNGLNKKKASSNNNNNLLECNNNGGDTCLTTPRRIKEENKKDNEQKDNLCSVFNSFISINSQKRSGKLFNMLNKILAYDKSFTNEMQGFKLLKASIYLNVEFNFNAAFQILSTMIISDVTIFQAHIELFKLLKAVIYINSNKLELGESKTLFRLAAFSFKLANLHTISLSIDKNHLLNTNDNKFTCKDNEILSLNQNNDNYFSSNSRHCNKEYQIQQQILSQDKFKSNSYNSGNKNKINTNAAKNTNYANVNAITNNSRNNNEKTVKNKKTIKNIEISQLNWIKIHYNLAKAFCLIGKPKEGINILVLLLEIFGVYYVNDDLKYLTEIYKSKKEIFNGFYVDFENVLEIFSKNSIYTNIQENVLCVKSKRRKSSVKLNVNLNKEERNSNLTFVTQKKEKAQ